MTPPITSMRLLSWARAREPWLIGTSYLVAYVILDGGSYVQPLRPFGITPWNPHTGLTFALILLFGGRYLPLLFVAPFLADLVVRGLPAPLPVEVLLSAVIGLGYGAATLLLIS